MGCGKGEAIKILKKLGFEHITLSSMIREEAFKRGIPEEREKLVEIGNEIRKREGGGALAARSIEKIKKSGKQNWVIDGIRNPAEISELRKNSDVRIVAIRASKETLVKRILGRRRESDPRSKKKIIEGIEREFGKGESVNGQQVAECISMADYTVENEGTLEELERKFNDYCGALRSYPRPSKDEYYLDLAKSVCRRGTCMKVEIGAVIIKDDQVVATGYCGAPRGTKSSQEHGFCLRKRLGIPSGHRYEMCRSVHAEQNAIINAARSGTSLLAGDIYIFGKTQGADGKPLDAFPCFICKKTLINCGLKRVICSLSAGGYKIFNVSDWIDEWSKNDIIDDKFQYGVSMDR